MEDYGSRTLNPKVVFLLPSFPPVFSLISLRINILESVNCKEYESNGWGVPTTLNVSSITHTYIYFVNYVIDRG